MSGSGFFYDVVYDAPNCEFAVRGNFDDLVFRIGRDEQNLVRFHFHTLEGEFPIYERYGQTAVVGFDRFYPRPKCPLRRFPRLSSNRLRHARKTWLPDGVLQGLFRSRDPSRKSSGQGEGNPAWTLLSSERYFKPGMCCPACIFSVLFP